MLLLTAYCLQFYHKEQDNIDRTNAGWHAGILTSAVMAVNVIMSYQQKLSEFLAQLSTESSQAGNVQKAEWAVFVQCKMLGMLDVSAWLASVLIWYRLQMWWQWRTGQTSLLTHLDYPFVWATECAITHAQSSCGPDSKMHIHWTVCTFDAHNFERYITVCMMLPLGCIGP